MMSRIILAFAFLLSVCIAQADDARILPEGTLVIVKKPDNPMPIEFSVIDQTHFIITRDELDRASAVDVVNNELKKYLIDCQHQLVQERNRDRGTRFTSVLKWTGVAASIVGAFYLGTRIR